MKKVLLDCDPGHDDMIAILLLCASKELEVLGISTVAGNQTIDKTYSNACKVLTLIGESSVPVVKGRGKPLFRDLVIAPNIHGSSGLDGSFLPESLVKPKQTNAIDFLTTTIMEEKEKVNIAATGPLTNVALALLKEPEIKKNIARIVIMGGAVYDSNITPSAEFNIYVDPEAAEIVFTSGLPITLVTLDVSNKTLFTPEDIATIRAMGGEVSKTVAALLDFFLETNKKVFGFEGAPLHDPITIAYLMDPSILKTRLLSVEVETTSKLTRGRTVADVYKVTGNKPNAEVSFELDVSQFKEMIFNAVAKYDR